MDDTNDAQPTTSAPAASQGARRPSRRWFLAGGTAVLIGAGAGVAADFVHGAPTPAAPEQAPAALRAARADEQALLAAVRRARADGSLTRDLAELLISDHEAHLAALTAALAGYAKSGRSGAGPTAGRADRASLRALEHRASHTAAERAARLSGPSAALLASIAACEATHAQVLA